MGEGRAGERTDREERQLELTLRYFRHGGLNAPGLSHLNRLERTLLFQELRSHHELLVAEGHEAEAQKLLGDLERLACPDDNLGYDFRRLQISDFERRGLGGRALGLMAELHAAEGRSRRRPERAAEIVMEYGILHERHGDKKEALRLFKNSVGRYERAEQPYNLSAAWFNSASVLYDLGNIRAALNACHKGLDCGGTDFNDLRAHILLQRANCREKTGEVGAACSDYLEAAQGYRTLGNWRQQTNILFRVGWLMSARMERAAEGGRYLRDALVLAKELDYAAGLARFHLHRAQCLMQSHLREAASGHLQHCLPHAKVARLDKVDKVARGQLYRLGSAGRRPLTFYLKARVSDELSDSLAIAQQGTYAHRGGDGAANRTWREAPRRAGQDVTFLVRLLAELGRRTGRADLLSQSHAVALWQRSIREGRRIL